MIYIDNIEFYRNIKTNFKLSSEYYNDIERVKE
jgi:RNAse (barnase) inhibitor barstar